MQCHSNTDLCSYDRLFGPRHVQTLLLSAHRGEVLWAAAMGERRGVCSIGCKESLAHTCHRDFRAENSADLALQEKDMPLPWRFNFSGDSAGEGHPREVEFHNTGLYNVPGKLSCPAPNVGIFEFTTIPGDVGKFKAPTLRNIAVTAPYMQDGSMATLEGVLDHYAAGGRTIASRPHAGIGHDNPNKAPLIGDFELSAQDRQDLIELLQSLTDEAVLHDPVLQIPGPRCAKIGTTP